MEVRRICYRRSERRDELADGTFEVACSACASYDVDLVHERLRQMFDRLGGVERFVPRGSVVLLKPNFLPGASAVSRTHPAVVAALCRILAPRASRILVGDGSVFDHGAEEVCRTAGAWDLVKEGAEVRPFVRTGRLKAVDEAYGGSDASAAAPPFFMVAEEVLEADVVIGVPKLKTHAQMDVTLAVKNMFGCIPGHAKARWHFRAGRDRDSFAAMLYRLYRSISPVLHVLDGIAAMEGNGPGAGDEIRVGLLAVSASGEALDAAVGTMVGFPPGSHPLGRLYLHRFPELERNTRVYWCGEEIAPPALRRARPLSHQWIAWEPLRALAERIFAPVPAVRARRCTGCGRCVRICPAGAVVLDAGGKAVIDGKRCIRCFCCQEVCPESAIEVGGRLAALLVRIGGGTWRL